MKFPVGVFFILCVLSSTVRAKAPAKIDTVASPTSEFLQPVTTEIVTYRFKLLIPDAIALGTGLLAVAAQSENLALFSSLSFVAGPMTIHGVNGNLTSTLLSPVLRVGLPWLGYIAGKAVAGCGHENDELDCGASESGNGAWIGLAAALAVDYIFLAKKEVSSGPRKLNIQPHFAPTPEKDGAVFGVSGNF